MTHKTADLITIIVPVFNVEKYLCCCIESILCQSYWNIEILLIDDGSQDNGGEICEEYAGKDSRIRVFHTENRGLSAARNLGLQEANGKYIGFVDSDDWIEPDMFDSLLERILTTGADISVCGYWREADRSVRQVHFRDALYTGEESLVAFVHGEMGNITWNKLYRKELFEGISYPVGRYFEDVFTTCRIISKCGAVVVNDSPEYHYRQRADSIVRTYSGKHLCDYADAHLLRFNYLREEHPQIFEENKEEILKSVTSSFFRVWRWWYGCTAADKQMYASELDGYIRFSREYIPVFGMKSWPIYLRIATLFIRKKSRIAFAFLYHLNQLLR